MKFVISILIFLLFSCGDKLTHFQSEKEMNDYVNDPDNGFIHSVETSDLLVECKLVPAIKNDPYPQVTAQIRINCKDGTSVLDFGNAGKDVALTREGYLSFEVMKDVYMESSDAIIPASFHHYERNYGLKPSVDLFFKFNHFEPKEDVYLNYRDQLFDQGLIRIKLKKELFTSCYVSK